MPEISEKLICLIYLAPVIVSLCVLLLIPRLVLSSGTLGEHGRGTSFILTQDKQSPISGREHEMSPGLNDPHRHH